MATFKKCGKIKRKKTGIITSQKNNSVTRTMFDLVLRRQETEGVALSHYK